MNSATNNLENDHIHILKLIDVMEHITQLKEPEITHIESIVDIIRNYADGLHHAKEEDIFFPFLAEKGFSSTQGPVAVMLHEHVQGRNYVKGIADNIPLYRNGDKGALNEIKTNMKGYIDLLRNHISKENNILFRMADNVISDSDNRKLIAQFDEAEKKQYSISGSVNFIKQIENLAAFYNV